MIRIEQLVTYFLGPLVVAGVLIACMFGLNLFLNRIFQGRPEKGLHRQFSMLVASLVSIVAFIALLPINDNMRGQILSLLGILLSAAIALSATNFLGNALAGIMLRVVRSFRIGDVIFIQERFGRVSARGLFHVEIQTEDSDLVTLPNLYVANNPVKVARKAGTIVSSEISLGYDLPHQHISTLLQMAAKNSGLEDPFVYLVKLGDFSIVYRVNGVLPDVKQLLSARSRLNEAILDVLHGEGVEIVSPNFMNTRNVEGQQFLSRPILDTGTPHEEVDPEDIIFANAEKAETLDELRASQEQIKDRLEALRSNLNEAPAEKRVKTELRIKRLEEQREQLEQKGAMMEKEIVADREG